MKLPKQAVPVIRIASPATSAGKDGVEAAGLDWRTAVDFVTKVGPAVWETFK